MKMSANFMRSGCCSASRFAGAAKYFLQWICLLALAAITPSAQSQTATLITFAAPANGYVATSTGTFTTSITLAGTANPSSLQVMLGSTNVTAQFNPAKCSQAPCTLTGTLTITTGVTSGENRLVASVSGASGAVATARQDFYYRYGLGDPTNGSGPGFLVAVQQTVPVGSNYTTITLNTPTPIQVAPCNLIRVVVLNRSTLQDLNSGNDCLYDNQVTAYLNTLSASDLVIVNAGDNDTQADYSPIGGSTAPDLARVGYTAIGYGGASAGSAFEAAQNSSAVGAAYNTIRGNLVNIGCTGRSTIQNGVAQSNPIAACSTTSSGTSSFYSFQPTNDMGFAMIPGVASSGGSPGLPTIYVGNSTNIPMGNQSTPPNQTLPLDSITNKSPLTYTTYTPTWTGGNAAGGMYLVTLNRIDLSLISQTLYVTNCGCTDHTTDNAQIAALAAAMGTGRTSAPNAMYLLTSVGIPFNADSDATPLLSAVAVLGVSPYALQSIIPDRLGNPGLPGFSMVGYATPNVVTVLTAAKSVSGVATTSSGLAKLYSSAGNVQEEETGAFRGVFSRNNTGYYEAIDAGPFDVSDLPVYATGNDFLAHSASFALGSTEPVAWPFMSTQAGQSAYAYISSQILNANLYASAQCQYNCGDVRYFYTSGNVNALVTGPLQPGAVPFNADNASSNGYTEADFANVRQQLVYEFGYVKNVLALQAYESAVNSGTSSNLALVLTQSGTNVANTLSNEFGQPKAATSNLTFAEDFFEVLGAAGHLPRFILQLATPEFGIGIHLVSGISKTIANVIKSDVDAQKASIPDPYVTQLQDLWETNSGNATNAALTFNKDAQTGTAVYFGGVLSDWFRLQSVSLMWVNQNYGGWFEPDAGTSQAAAVQGYLDAVSLQQQTQIWQQIVPQYFAKAQYNGAASGWLLANGESSLASAAQTFASAYPQNLGNPVTAQGAADINLGPDYSWDMRTSAGSAACQDYTYLFKNQSWGSFWQSAFGDILMGSPTSSSPLGNLNIDRNWLMDEWGIAWFEFNPNSDNEPPSFSMNFPQTVTNTKGNNSYYPYNISFGCSSHPNPFGGNQTAFTVSASQTISQGTASILLSGTILAGSKVPPGSVTATINDVTNSTTINSDGSFSFPTWNTANIPGSPTPYVITYSYAGNTTNGTTWDPATDTSTTLTVNSTDTEVQLIVDNSTVYYGQAVNFTATVKSPAGTPTGTVEFWDELSATKLCSLTLTKVDSNSATALCSLTQNAGQYLVYAKYLGAAPIAAGVSDNIYETVTQLTTIVYGYNPTPGTYGAATTQINGQIGGSNGSRVVNYPVGGNLTITVGTLSPQTVPMTGPYTLFSVNYPTAGLGIGTYPVTIQYAGSTNFSPMTDTSKTITIGKGVPTIAISNPTPTVAAGSATVQLSGKVVPPPNSVTPTGQAQVLIDGVYSAQVPLQSDGSFTVSYPTTTLLAGSYQIEYIYWGDSNYQVVSDVSTNLTVTSTPIVTQFYNITSPPPTDYETPTVTLSGNLSAAIQTSGAAQFTTASSSPSTGVSIPFTSDPVVATPGGTFSTWIKTTTTTTQDLMVIPTNRQTGFDTTSNSVIYLDSSGQIGMHWYGVPHVDGAKDWETKNITTTLTDGQWHHISIAFGATNSLISQDDWFALLYVDGVPEGEYLDLGLGSWALSSPLSLGAASTDANIQSFNGEFWNAKVWNRELTAQDVQADMYQVYSGTLPSGLVLMSTFSVSNNTATNAVGSQAATSNYGTIVSDQQPVQSPPAGTQISITIGTNTQSTKLTGNNGAFSFAFPTSEFVPSGYVIDYSYEGSGNFLSANNSDTSLTIKPAATATTISSSSSTVGYNTPVTLTAQVATIDGGSAPTAGNVTFYDSGVAIPESQTLLTSTGTVNFTTNSLAFGSHTITAVYSGWTNFAGSQSTPLMQTVSILTPTITVLTKTPQVSYGTGSVQLNGTILAGTTVPPGNVYISINNGTEVPAQIGSDGSFSASVSTSSLVVGTYPIAYTFNAIAGFNKASDTGTSLAVVAGSTSTTISSSAHSAPYGTMLTFTATVSGTGSTPTGTVLFSDESGSLGSPVALVNGQAVFQTGLLPVGSHSVTATFSDSTSNYATSTSQQASENIASLTPVFSNLTPSQTVTAGAKPITLSGTLSVPNGPTSGIATTTQASTDGSYGVFYTDLDANAITTDAATFSVWINTSTTAQQMILQSPNVNPCIYLQNNQLALIWLSAGSPALGWVSTDTTPVSDGHWHHIAISLNKGAITFYKDGVATQDSLSVGNSSISTSAINFGGGAYEQIPTFVGQMWNAEVWSSASAASDIQSQMYQNYTAGFPASLKLLSFFDSSSDTATNLVDGASARVINVNMLFGSVPFLGQYPAPKEQISASIHSVPQQVTIGSYGTFTTTYPVESLRDGTYPIDYSYSGNSYLAPATPDQSTSLTVMAATTKITMAPANPSVNYGTQVSFTATVTSDSGTPTGSVQFYDGTSPLGSAITPLTAGGAVYTTSTLSAGTHSINAVYTSDVPTFANSTSTFITQVINAESPTFSNLATPTVPAGTATVTLGGTIAAGTVIPAGDTITITVNNTQQVLTIHTDGTFSASFTTSSWTAGTYPISYVYNGSLNFNPVTSSTNPVLTITSAGPQTPTITVSASPNPVVIGNNVTFQATVQQIGSNPPTGNVTFSETVDENLQPLPNVITYGSASLTSDSKGIATIVITPSSQPALTVGTHMLSATYGGDGGVNYNGASTQQFFPLVVNDSGGLGATQNPFDLSVASGGSTSVTVNQGVPASFPLTLSPASGYSGTVALTCAPSQAVTNMTCSLSPALITLNGASQSSVVTITTTDGVTANVRLAACLIGGLAFGLSFRRRLRPIAMLVILLVGFLTTTGCGGNGPNISYAGPGAYKFTVTASSTSGTASTSSLTLTVIVNNH